VALTLAGPVPQGREPRLLVSRSNSGRPKGDGKLVILELLRSATAIAKCSLLPQRRTDSEAPHWGALGC